jgi:hypothetical protein
MNQLTSSPVRLLALTLLGVCLGLATVLLLPWLLLIVLGDVIADARDTLAQAGEAPPLPITEEPLLEDYPLPKWAAEWITKKGLK